MPFYPQHVRAAQLHLRRADPVLRGILRRVGPFTLRTQRDRFRMLTRSIISQQISTAAASTITQRLFNHFDAQPMSAHSVAQLKMETLRGFGVSRQKATYLLDLAERVADGRLNLDGLGRASDDDVVAALTQVRGIGVWTAQMFLIFSLGRLDVLPVGDLGIRAAIRDAYRTGDLPSAKQIEEIAHPWKPYSTVASWYLWRTLDNPPE